MRRLKDLDEPLTQRKRQEWETWIGRYEADLAEEHAELSAKQFYDVSPCGMRVGSSTRSTITGE
jgi:hypothetical protein